MREVGQTVAGLDLRYQSAARGHGVFLKFGRVEVGICLHRVDVHVEQRCGDKLGGCEALIEQRGFVYLGYQIVRHGLARLVVRRILFEYLLLECPILHDLRRQLYEVALDLGQTAVTHVGEEEVQCVAELVEQRLGLVDREQCRRIADRAREVAYYAYRRSHTLAVLVSLLGKVAAPCAAALARAREQVEIQYAQMRVVDVEHLECRALGVVLGYAYRAERDAVEAVG